MRATVRLDVGVQAVGSARQHTWMIDEAENDGGTDLGPSPTEILVSSLASCAAITSKLYAQRKGWALESVEIDVQWQRFKRAEYPDYEGEGEIINEIRQRIKFTGDLTAEQKQRLLEIAGRCPVHRLLTQPIVLIEELAADDLDLSEQGI